MIDNKHWGHHIKRLREERGLTQAELARRSGLSRGHIARIEVGGYKGTQQQTFECLARGLGLSLSDLSKVIRGETSIIRQETPEDILERLKVAISSTVPIYEDFPFHAGAPVEPIDYVPVVKDRAKGRNLEGYIAHGKCLEPDIKDGDIIIVNREGEIDNGNIAACLVRGELYLARLRRIGEELYLENNDGRIKLEDCQIAASVIEIRRRLK